MRSSASTAAGCAIPDSRKLLGTFAHDTASGGTSVIDSARTRRGGVMRLVEKEPVLRAALRVVAGVALAALVTKPASLLAQDWRGGKARVDGIVKSTKGEPIEGCKVSLRWGRSTHGGADLTTDKKGRAAI